MAKPETSAEEEARQQLAGIAHLAPLSTLSGRKGPFAQPLFFLVFFFTDRGFIGCFSTPFFGPPLWVIPVAKQKNCYWLMFKIQSSAPSRVVSRAFAAPFLRGSRGIRRLGEAAAGHRGHGGARLGGSQGARCIVVVSIRFCNIKCLEKCCCPLKNKPIAVLFGGVGVFLVVLVEKYGV